MNNQYHCDTCGCYLDPGEGRICDDCRREAVGRRNRAERRQEAVREAEGGQMEMRLQEAIR